MTHQIISWAQVAVAIVLIALILLQERSSGLTGLLGGGGDGGYYQTRRGLEKLVFIATIVLAAAFVILSLLNLAL